MAQLPLLDHTTTPPSPAIPSTVLPEVINGHGPSTHVPPSFHSERVQIRAAHLLSEQHQISLSSASSSPPSAEATSLPALGTGNEAGPDRELFAPPTSPPLILAFIAIGLFTLSMISVFGWRRVQYTRVVGRTDLIWGGVRGLGGNAAAAAAGRTQGEGDCVQEKERPKLFDLWTLDQETREEADKRRRKREGKRRSREGELEEKVPLKDEDKEAEWKDIMPISVRVIASPPNPTKKKRKSKKKMSRPVSGITTDYNTTTTAAAAAAGQDRTTSQTTPSTLRFSLFRIPFRWARRKYFRRTPPPPPQDPEILLSPLQRLARAENAEPWVDYRTVQIPSGSSRRSRRSISSQDRNDNEPTSVDVKEAEQLGDGWERCPITGMIVEKRDVGRWARMRRIDGKKKKREARAKVQVAVAIVMPAPPPPPLPIPPVIVENPEQERKEGEEGTKRRRKRGKRKTGESKSGDSTSPSSTDITIEDRPPTRMTLTSDGGSVRTFVTAPDEQAEGAQTPTPTDSRTATPKRELEEREREEKQDVPISSGSHPINDEDDGSSEYEDFTDSEEDDDDDDLQQQQQQRTPTLLNFDTPSSSTGAAEQARMKHREGIARQVVYAFGLYECPWSLSSSTSSSSSGSSSSGSGSGSGSSSRSRSGAGSGLTSPGPRAGSNSTQGRVVSGVSVGRRPGGGRN